jgi:CheY-like chemotaxis protein
VRDQTVREIVGGSALWCRDGVLPLSSMASALGISAQPGKPISEPLAVVLSTAGSLRWAFSLGGVIGDFELVRKPCDALLTACLGYVASATLDDGRLVLYLNPAELLQRAGSSRVPYKRQARQPGRHVLVVDDSAIIRHLLSLVLAAGGYEVATAENGRQALLRCEEGLPELIVSDVDMPEMDGLQLLGNVRARWPNLPVIIFTNHASSELRQRAQSLGANEYVVKADFEQEEILQAAERVLRGRGAVA